MKNHQKFLQFNGKNILFTTADNENWIAVKPICEALNVNYNRQFQNIKNDPILGFAFAVQQMQVPGKSGIQGRKMICILEQYVYGWIFSIKSDSEELIAYKKTCYELLFNHFHGGITGRKELLIERSNLDHRIHTLKQELKENDSKYKELQDLQQQRKTLSASMNKMDNQVISQVEINFN